MRLRSVHWQGALLLAAMVCCARDCAPGSAASRDSGLPAPICVKVPLLCLPDKWHRDGDPRRLTGPNGVCGWELAADNGEAVSSRIRKEMDSIKGRLRSEATAGEGMPDRDKLFAYGDVLRNGAAARSLVKSLDEQFMPVPKNARGLTLLESDDPESAAHAVTPANLRKYGRYLVDAYDVTHEKGPKAVMVEVSAEWFLVPDPTARGTTAVRVVKPQPTSDTDGTPAQAEYAWPTQFGIPLGVKSPPNYPDLDFVGGIAVQDNLQGGLLGFNASMGWKEGIPLDDWRRLGILGGRSIGPNAAYILGPSYRIGNRAWVYAGEAFGAGHGHTRESFALGFTVRLSDVFSSTVTGGGQGGAEPITAEDVFIKPQPAAPVAEEYAAIHIRGMGLLQADDLARETAWVRQPVDREKDWAFVQLARKKPGAVDASRLTKLWDILYQGRRDKWEDKTWKAQAWGTTDNDADCVIFEPKGDIDSLNLVTRDGNQARPPLVRYTWPGKDDGPLTVYVMDGKGVLKPARSPISLKEGEVICIEVRVK